MIQKVLVPKLGQTMEEATIETWRVKEGDQVAKGDILLDITTDKATLEVESYVAGTVRKIMGKEGDVLPVNAVIALVGDPGDEIPDDIETPTPLAEAPAEKARAAAGPAHEPAPAAALSARPSGRVVVSPRARRLAREKKVSVRVLSGSGPKGRIVEADVNAYLDRVAGLRITPTAREAAYQKDIDIATVRGSGPGGRITKEDVLKAPAARAIAPGERVPLTAMRRVVAERMSRSKREIPHFYIVANVDMTEAVAFRAKLNAQSSVKVAFHDLIIKAGARGLREFPRMNASWQGDAIQLRNEINIGLAVALEEGLIVPVVRNAERLSLLDVARASSSLIERARGKKLTPDEYMGGCLTISNLGIFDVDFFIPVINPGESAILGVGRIAPKPAVRDGDIHVRSMMSVTLAGDHRVIDGAIAAGFLKCVKDLLESPESLA